MDKVKVKQQVYGMGGSLKGKDWCAPGEAEMIGEKKMGSKEPAAEKYVRETKAENKNID